METVRCCMQMVTSIEDSGSMAKKRVEVSRFIKTKEFSTTANGRTTSLTEKANFSFPTTPNTKASSRAVLETALASFTKQAKRSSTNRSTKTAN